MYSVKIRDSVMIAHSLPDPFFGPAQRMHGATFVVDVEFFAGELDRRNVVLDITRARAVTSEVLDTLRYRNLDEESRFEGKLTTAEFVARYVHDAVRDALSAEFSGKVKVVIRETHDAWVSYEGEPSTS